MINYIPKIWEQQDEITSAELNQYESILSSQDPCILSIYEIISYDENDEILERRLNIPYVTIYNAMKQGIPCFVFTQTDIGREISISYIASIDDFAASVIRNNSLVRYTVNSDGYLVMDKNKF